LAYALTGVGKGASSILPLGLGDDGRAVGFAPKRGAAPATAAWRRGVGHPIEIIEPFGITGLRNTFCDRRGGLNGAARGLCVLDAQLSPKRPALP
jgi:hypothetical protein